MAIDIHLYANGNDPFTFPLEPYIVHVHAGPPPGTSGTAPGPAPSPRPEPAPSQPRLWEYPTETPVGPPIRATYVHGAEQVRNWLSQVYMGSSDQPVRFRLDAVSSPFRPEIQTLLEGLPGLGDRGVNVDIVGWSEPGSG